MSLGKEIIIQLGFEGGAPGLLCSLPVYLGGEELSPSWIPADFAGDGDNKRSEGCPRKLLVGRQRSVNKWGAGKTVTSEG